MIRHAVIADIPVIVRMGRAFHAMSPHRTMGEYNDEAIAALLTHLIADDSGLLLVNETGMIGGKMSPIYFDPTKQVMEEMFWYANGGGRELLMEFIERAKAMGASCILLSALMDARLSRTNQIVTGMGFRPTECRYVMEF